MYESRIHIIFIIVCMILFSCENKSNEKTILLLTKENKLLKDSILLKNKIMEKFYDSTYRIQINKLPVCGDIFIHRYIINNTNSKNIKFNSEFRTTITFVETSHLDFGSNSVSIIGPVRSKNLIDTKEQNIKLNYDSEYGNFAEFSFRPNDTGWYYWQSIWKERNDRTMQITKYSKLDSFYVYK